MTELFVSRSDLDNLTQTLAANNDIPEPLKALLSQLVDDIKTAMEDLDEALVTVVPAPDDAGPAPVEPEQSIGAQFANAFTPAAAPASVSHGVEIRLHKVHR